MPVPSTLLVDTLRRKTELQSAGGGEGVVSRSEPEEVDRPRRAVGVVTPDDVRIASLRRREERLIHYSELLL